jgi:site-specific recombinase XerD
MILQTAYAAGLRVSEVVRLQVGDIDSSRMTLHVRCAKGRKDQAIHVGIIIDLLISPHGFPSSAVLGFVK